LTRERYEQIAVRDRRADGRFFTGVTSTGIVCRPSCPARTPKPGNVVFFDTYGQAVAAGFRPCKRCRPDALAEDVTAARRVAAAILFEAGASELSAAEAKAFRRVLGLTPAAFGRAARTERFRIALQSEGDVLAAVFAAGFASTSRAYDAAPASLGMTPAAYARGGADLVVRVGAAPCSLGFVGVAETDQGVCAVTFADTAEAALAAVRARLSRADLASLDGRQVFLDLVAAAVEEPGLARSIPVDVRQTAFAARVSAALRAIPPGETRTYRQVAEALSQPKAARAVARACAANPAALLIPCHRVIGSDGGLRGYAYGLERKAALLKREAALAKADDAD
jgi:AraC family transcriptional regulator of adaptative response/methylated-DNA-[protein]-cysteine methyltransferase